MSTLMESALQDHGASAAISAHPVSGSEMTIKRAGGRPLRFHGSELAMAMSFTPSCPFWYEINLYRTSSQSFVTAVRLFFQSTERQDTVRAWESPDIEAAIEKLVAYDAAYDVMVDPPLDMVSTAPAALAAQALNLQARISETRHHYKSLVGELLHELDPGL